MKLKRLLNEMDMGPTPNSPTTTSSNRLTKMSGREYAYSGPASQRITRNDKVKFLTSRDKTLDDLSASIDNAFKMVIAAANIPGKSSLQSFIIQKLNAARTQIVTKIEQEQAIEAKKKV